MIYVYMALVSTAVFALWLLALVVVLARLGPQLVSKTIVAAMKAKPKASKVRQVPPVTTS